MDLQGKTALVTGSNRGIGRACALKLASLGADVAVHYAGRADAAEKVREQILSMGRRCTVVRSDLSDGGCAESVAEQLKGFGDIDILVLNASVQIKKPWETITLQDFDTQISCNLRASLLLIQKFVPRMKEKRWGRIVTVGSVQEQKPHPDMLIYSASKAAQTAMAKSLAVQLAGYGVTVNCLAPGVILTDRNSEALSDKTYYEQVLSKIPAGFCGEPEDCAEALAILCSPEGRYITGQNLFVDGGMGIK